MAVFSGRLFVTSAKIKSSRHFGQCAKVSCYPGRNLAILVLLSLRPWHIAGRHNALARTAQLWHSIRAHAPMRTCDTTTSHVPPASPLSLWPCLPVSVRQWIARRGICTCRPGAGLYCGSVRRSFSVHRKPASPGIGCGLSHTIARHARTRRSPRQRLSFLHKPA